MLNVKRRTATGRIKIITPVFGIENIVGFIVDAAITQSRTELVALPGMVEHDVENNLDIVSVEGFDHILKFADIVTAQVRLLGSKEGKAFISPVIVNNITLFVPVAEKGVNRQQFDRGNAQPLKIVDNRPVRHAGKSAAFGIGNFRMQAGKSAGMGFVNHGIFKRTAQRFVAFPVVGVVNNHRLRHIGRAVQFGERQILVRTVPVVAENGLMPDELADQLPAIGINQQLVRIKTLALFRPVRAINAVAVDLPRLQSRHIDMPDAVVIFGYGVTLHLLRAGFVKQAKLNLFGMSGKQGKVNTLAIVNRTERIGFSDCGFAACHCFSPLC